MRTADLQPARTISPHMKHTPKLLSHTAAMDIDCSNNLYRVLSRSVSCTDQHNELAFPKLFSTRD